MGMLRQFEVEAQFMSMPWQDCAVAIADSLTDDGVVVEERRAEMAKRSSQVPSCCARAKEERNGCYRANGKRGDAWDEMTKATSISNGVGTKAGRRL